MYVLENFVGAPVHFFDIYRNRREGRKDETKETKYRESLRIEGGKKKKERFQSWRKSEMQGSSYPSRSFLSKTLLEDRFAVALPVVSRGSWSRAPGPRDLAMLHMWAKMWDRPRVCESDDDACVFLGGGDGLYWHGLKLFSFSVFY